MRPADYGNCSLHLYNPKHYQIIVNLISERIKLSNKFVYFHTASFFFWYSFPINKTVRIIDVTL